VLLSKTNTETESPFSASAASPPKFSGAVRFGVLEVGGPPPPAWFPYTKRTALCVEPPCKLKPRETGVMSQ